MDDKSRIEQLERRIADLEEQIKALKDEQKADARSLQKMKLEELEVEHIKVVEKDGTVRVSLHNQERKPGPPTRKGGPSAGMLFFAEDSREVGGLSISKLQSITFDQHNSDQVVGLVNWGSVRGLYVWDRPPGSMPEFIEQFEREHGRRPSVLEVEFPRVFAGRGMNGEAKVSLSDSKGRERLRLLVDSKDTPRVELLNENGEVIHWIAPKSFEPLKFPPTDSVLKDQTARTPAHLLGLCENNFDQALRLLDGAREGLGEEVYKEWREWLLTAKMMNTA